MFILQCVKQSSGLDNNLAVLIAIIFYLESHKEKKMTHTSVAHYKLDICCHAIATVHFSGCQGSQLKPIHGSPIFSRE